MTGIGSGIVLAWLACQSGSVPGPEEESDTGNESENDTETAPPDTRPLQVAFLGVGGVSLRRGEDLILTAPMYTNPGLLDVTLGEIASDPDLVERFLADEDIVGAGAILVGHAHYDHLLDVPHVQGLAGSDPVVYANVSARNLLAGVAGLDRVVAVNDPTDPRVDSRMCAVPDPCTGVSAGNHGVWIEVPEAHARVRALCSTHPAQFLDIVHFAEGCVEEPAETPPASAADWLEGATLGWLVDFLAADGTPSFRIYYQDAPTRSPIGLVHPDLLAEHPVDLAVLNVGSYDAVRDHPTEALANLSPRYVLGIHWEDFFRTQDESIEPIPFQADPEVFDERAQAALPAGGEAPVSVDGVSEDSRYWRPLPGTRFEFPAADAPTVAVVDPPEARTETSSRALALRTDLPARVEDCAAPDPCDDIDGDGLVDSWEDLALDRLRPTLRFDEAEPMLFDADAGLFAVGRVAPAADGHIRVWIMLGFRRDYGRCGLTSHAGDSERVVLDLAPLTGGGSGDFEVVGVYTAAHEGSATDHGELLVGDDLAVAEFPADPATGEPRWRIYSSDGKHASYPTVQLCEDAEWALCVEEDCAPDGVDDVAAYDRLLPIANAGEPGAPRLEDLAIVGFAEEQAWVEQPFCGGEGRQDPCSTSVLSKLVDDPFD